MPRNQRLALEGSQPGHVNCERAFSRQIHLQHGKQQLGLGQDSPRRTVTMAGSYVHSCYTHNAPDAGADDQHGYKQPAGNGTARCPSSPHKVYQQHDNEGAIAKLAVGASGQQVPDGLLPCT